MPSTIFRGLIDELESDYENLEQHYKGVSLFIESLFRLSHFQKGQFVLRRRTTRVTKEIIEPQLQPLYRQAQGAPHRDRHGRRGHAR